MRLLLARHAETDQTAGHYIGSTDLSISGKGRKQAEILADTLRPYPPLIWFYSPLLRVWQTAEVIGRRSGCGFELLEQLREIDFGSWEGLSFAEICRRDRDLVARWHQDLLSFRFPDGEHNGQFWQRVHEVVRLLTARPEEEVLVVSHGGVIRAMICLLLGLSFENYLIFDVKPASLAVLDVYGDKGVLAGLNL